MPHVIDAHTVDPLEIEKISALAHTLPQGSPIAVLLQHVVTASRRGVDLTLFEADQELTPNETADLLRMSRPHLLKFLDNGEIEFNRVGSHRRIPMSAILDFIDRRERAKALIAHAVGSPAALTARAMNNAGELSDADRDELNAL